jgi:hypothetical protein
VGILGSISLSQKQYLNLDNAMYRQTRDHFQRICEEAGFIKKTAAGRTSCGFLDETRFFADPLEMVSGLAVHGVVEVEVFPSETTIDESKQYLNLDNAMYRQTRDHFQRICDILEFDDDVSATPNALHFQSLGGLVALGVLR